MCSYLWDDNILEWSFPHSPELRHRDNFLIRTHHLVFVGIVNALNCLAGREVKVFCIRHTISMCLVIFFKPCLSVRSFNASSPCRPPGTFWWCPSSLKVSFQIKKPRETSYIASWVIHTYTHTFLRLLPPPADTMRDHPCSATDFFSFYQENKFLLSMGLHGICEKEVEDESSLVCFV